VHLHGQPRSNLDPPGLIPRIPGRTAAFAKRALFHLPVFGYCLKLGGFIPVDRKGNAITAQESVAAAKRILDKGIHITTFVEGTRSRTAACCSSKGSVLPGDGDRRAVHSGVNLRDGDADVERQFRHQAGDRALRLSMRRSTLAIMPRAKKLMQAVRAAIASGLPEWMRG